MPPPTRSRVGSGTRNNPIASSRTTPVVSRDPKAGYATEERTSFEKIPDLLKKDGATAATIFATNDVNGPTTPTTAIVATSNMDGVTLNRVGGEGHVGSDSFLKGITTAGLTGEERPDCEPTF
ncbi:hypothetical protein ABZX98_32630 [Streptomyces sp. NPDC002992]|uniref:hypothetical protein n=1 Tax=Streptomyces sp. NPDC002992 TaxID=3154273 RepID=UPI0033B31BF9